MLFVNYVLKGKERIDYLDKKLDNYTLSDLRLETKGFQFESPASFAERWTLSSNLPDNASVKR